MEHTQAHNQKSQDMKGQAKTSLAACMGAVQQVLNDMPDNVVTMPVNATQAFLLVDPVLSTLNKQLSDARAQYTKFVAMLGTGDPMAEALLFQITAIERAYNERLAMLRKKREEGSRGVNNNDTSQDNTDTAESKKQLNLKHTRYSERRKNYGAMWLLAMIVIGTKDPYTKNRRWLVPRLA